MNDDVFRIGALQAEVTVRRLRGKEAADRIARLEKDLDRLRAALDEVVAVLGPTAAGCEANTCAGCLEEMVMALDAARAALAPAGEGTHADAR